MRKDKISVKAPDRVKAMLKKRAEWAKEKEIKPKIIVKIYSDLLRHFRNEAMAKWKKENKGSLRKLREDECDLIVLRI